MFSRVTSRSSRTFQLRNRAAVLAAGLGASVVLGTGVAAAANTATAPTTATVGVANAVKAQAAAQAKAAAVAAAANTKATAKVTQVKSAPVKKAAGWTAPVKSYQLSASYAQAGGMWQSTHSGQDFAVPTGTPVVAAGAGTVVKAGGNGAGDGPAYGNAVVIRHANGVYTQYAHLSSVNVSVGQSVGAGQRIALSGNTGNSSGPHLHFEVRTSPNYGSAMNPVAFLRGKGVTL
ncbi:MULTISPECIES: M23 family metallopeptidase [Streptomyces]|uniref:M23 family peptidase n=1 Tax=Streptomyces cadmiisoli TaxID=2184053 RepID=A0A2Z4J1J1_9ACTN|nr:MULTISPECIES: M23 family metallopeptidase [Streptomyces]AWW38313.1 M23 family peptidase [Streptomyces cadmiisoli]KOV52014.1 peptidase [Streptomyces sp. AS58]